jgi:hypothetical protein
VKIMVKMDFGKSLIFKSHLSGVVLAFEFRSADKSQNCRSITHPRTGDDTVGNSKGVCSKSC